MSNLILKKTIICDDWGPSWINHHIKNFLPYKDNFYKKFVHGKKQYVPSFNF